MLPYAHLVLPRAPRLLSRVLYLPPLGLPHFFPSVLPLYFQVHPIRCLCWPQPPLYTIARITGRKHRAARCVGWFKTH